MRILYVCPDRGIRLTGAKGAAAHVRSMVKALVDLGHDVRVLAADAGHGTFDVPVQRIPAPEIVDDIIEHTDPRSARALGHIWFNAAVADAVRDAITQFRPDIVYERYSPFGVAASMVAAARGVRHQLEVNAPLAWEGARFRRQALTEAANTLERAAFQTTSGIIAVSGELRDLLIADGVEPTKITVVPNGVDTAVFAPSGPTFEGTHPLDATVIGFVGSLKRWHGIDVLAETVRRLAPDPQFHLLVVGDGPEAGIIDTLSADLPGRVTHVREACHDDIPRYLRAMHIAVAPYPALARFYYSPLKILEYMATGRAIVASAIGQVGELLRAGETAVLVPPGEVPALTEAIRALAADEARRRVLGMAAAQDAVSQHRWIDRATRIVGLARAAA